jgi:hypothetical protein
MNHFGDRYATRRRKSRPAVFAGLAQLAVAAAGLGLAGYAVLALGGAASGGVKAAVVVPGVLVALLALAPVRAAVALFRGTPDAARRARQARAGCGFPLVFAFVLGVAALVRSLASADPVTQVLPYLLLMAAAGGLILAADAIARRAADLP